MPEDLHYDASLPFFPRLPTFSGYFQALHGYDNNLHDVKVSHADSRLVVILITQDLRWGDEAEVLLVRSLACVEHDASFLECGGQVRLICSQEIACISVS